MNFRIETSKFLLTNVFHQFESVIKVVILSRKTKIAQVSEKINKFRAGADPARLLWGGN